MESLERGVMSKVTQSQNHGWDTRLDLVSLPTYHSIYPDGPRSPPPSATSNSKIKKKKASTHKSLTIIARTTQRFLPAWEGIKEEGQRQASMHQSLLPLCIANALCQAHWIYCWGEG